MPYKVKEEFVLDLNVAHPPLFSEASDNPLLVITIEAIHAGTTKNYNTYTADELQKAVSTWTEPYRRPVLAHHMLRAGEPIGRIQNAYFTKSKKADVKCIELIAHIVDPEAAKKILDERYLTVSVGASAEHAICSICGQDLVNGWCDHRPGQEYDGQVAHVILREITFLEVSFVNAPADELAGVVDIASEGTYLVSNDGVIDLGAEAGTNLLDSLPGDEMLAFFESLGIDSDLWEEAPKGKDGEPINRMKTGTKRQAYYGHNLLHGWWHQPSKTNWTKEQIVAEHTRVVRIILDKGWKHPGGMHDSLDDTLPEDLKKRTRAQSEETEATKKQLQNAHDIMHRAWKKNKGDKDIVAAHIKIVKQMLEAGMKHSMMDDLDDTLPEDMKKMMKKMMGSSLEGGGTEMEEEIRQLKEQVAKMEVDLENSNKEIASLNERLQALQQENEALKSEKAKLETRISDMESDLLVARTEVQVLREEHDDLVASNTELAGELQRYLAEQVVDLKIALGRPGISDRAQAVAEHIERTQQSLRDSLAELLEEKRLKESAPPALNNPGLEFPEGQPAAKLSREEAILKLFGGSRRKKEDKK